MKQRQTDIASSFNLPSLTTSIRRGQGVTSVFDMNKQLCSGVKLIVADITLLLEKSGYCD